MNVLPVTRQRAVVAATLGVVGLFSASRALAAAGTFSATPVDTNFANAANWVGAVPGVINANALNTDVATFNTPIANVGGINIGDAANPILIDAGRVITGIVFDTASVGSYHIGSPAGNALTLYTNQANSTINLTATANASQYIDGNLLFRQPSSTNGAYTFQNNSTNTAATLNFTGAVTNSGGTNRNVNLILGGTNTGLNTISGNLSLGTGSSAVIPLLTKNGAGTWVLSGNNVFTGGGTAATNSSTNAAGGIVINAGVLSAQNNNALGQAVGVRTFVNNGGTLEIGNNISLFDGLLHTVRSGGTIRGVGTAATNATTAIDTAAATSVTFATTNAGDVFTIGNNANDLTGGASDGVINIAGPGTVVLAQSSNYAGGFSLNSGTTRLTASNALGAGTGALAFGAGSTAVLQLNGQSATVGGLNSNATPGTPVIESAGSGTSTLTVNNAAASTYGGLIRDGSAGQVAITKTAVGTLTLGGANTYTGGTAINAGSLLANNATGSATGTGAVNVNANGTLGGSGTANGDVFVNTGGRIAPGAAAGQVGTLTVKTLTLASGSQLDFDATNATTRDQIVVTQSGGLAINGGQFNLNGGTTAFTTNGVYNLIGYTGAISGSGVSALSLNAANKNLATNNYTFGTAGGYVTLTIANSGGTISYWNADASGTWSAGPWTPSQPNAVGAFASFGGGGVPITQNRTITVDTAKTVGTIAFNNTTGQSYTVAGPGAITLNNGGTSSSFITDTAGNHAINAPLVTTANGLTTTVAQAADTLTLGGAISGPAAVTKFGLGTLAVTGNNTYTGGTTITAGTIAINSGTSLGDTSGALNFAGGTLGLLADVATTRTYNTDASGVDVRINTNGFTLNHSGTINAVSGSVSGLTKSGSGTLVLAGANTYQGATTVTGGTVSISSNPNLGDEFLGSAVNLNGGTLATTATLSLDNLTTNPRAINVGAAGGGLDVADGTSLTVFGLISGPGTLKKTNTGTLLLWNTANTGALDLAGGTVTAANNIANTNGGLGTGPLTLEGGVVVNSSFSQNNSLGLGNAITVPAGQTATFNAPNRFSLGGTLSGGGTLNFGVNTNASRFDFNGNYTAFTGNINLTGTGNVRFFSNGGGFNANSFQTTTLDLGGTVNIAPVTNTNGNTYLIGALTGTSLTASLGGGTVGSPNYTIGGLNTSTTYNGLITGNAILTKVGSGSLTLTGANQYTGITNVNGGSLVINGQFALGGGNYAGTTFNGGQLGYTAAVDGLNGGTDITADANGVAKPVTLLAGGGTVNTNGNTVAFANPITGTGGFTKAGAGTLTLNGVNTYAGATTVTGGVLVSGPANTAGLLANTNGINIANGNVVLDYTGSSSPVATVRSLLANSFNDLATPGVMETGQIRSSTATEKRGIGYVEDVATSRITLKATLFGDADLDGGVSINDFNALAGNFGQASNRVWAQGDFDYDGGVSINDFNLLAGNFGQTLPATSEAWAGLIAFAAAHNDMEAFQAITGVPEPTSLGLIAAGATLGLRRRRRTA